MKMALRLSLLVYLFCLFTAGFAAAQAITTGVIQGSVLDPQGEALPGAQVEARNVGTNGWRIHLGWPGAQWFCEPSTPRA